MMSYSQRRKLYGKIIITGIFFVAVVALVSGETDGALVIFAAVSGGAVLKMWDSS